MVATQVPEPVRSFIEAVNAHDEDSFLDAFVERGFVDDWGRVFTGREAIRRWSRKEFIGARGTLDVQTVQVEGSRITVVGDWRSSYANGLSMFTFEVEGGGIVSMTIREG